MTSSEVSRPDLYLGAFDGVEVSLPGNPVHAVTVRRVITVEVQPVQVGAVAVLVPPGAFEAHGAVLPITLVVVSVFGGEGHRIVIPRQWVPRCTYVDNISLSSRPILSMCYLCTDQLETRAGRGVGGEGGGGGELRREFDKNPTSLGWGISPQHQRGGDLIWCLDFMFRCRIAPWSCTCRCEFRIDRSVHYVEKKVVYILWLYQRILYKIVVSIDFVSCPNYFSYSISEKSWRGREQKPTICYSPYSSFPTRMLHARVWDSWRPKNASQLISE